MTDPTPIAAVLMIPERRAAYWVSLVEAWPDMHAAANHIAHFEQDSDAYTFEMVQQLDRHRERFLAGG